MKKFSPIPACQNDRHFDHPFAFRVKLQEVNSYLTGLTTLKLALGPNYSRTMLLSELITHALNSVFFRVPA